jgi:hypothetical protein
MSCAPNISFNYKIIWLSNLCLSGYLKKVMSDSLPEEGYVRLHLKKVMSDSTWIRLCQTPPEEGYVRLHLKNVMSDSTWGRLCQTPPEEGYVRLHLKKVMSDSLPSGGFRGGVWGVCPPPKIRKAYVIQR